MDHLFQAHEFSIFRTSYTNGNYASYNLTHLYATDGFSRPSQGPTGAPGPTGPTGSIGIRGPVGCVGSAYVEEYVIKPRRYEAYKIVCRPREDTKESYESLVMPYNQEYNDLGTQITILQPDQIQVKTDLKPEFQGAFDNLTRLNNEVPLFNDCIQYLFTVVSNETPIEIEDYLKTTNLGEESRNDLREVYNRMRQDFANYRHYPAGDGGYYIPQIRNYTRYERNIPSQWYNHETIVHYNNNSKLEIYAHQGTELFNVIRSLIPNESAGGGFTKKAR